VTAGAVLCGGRSRRMGTDKAFVEVAGVPMAELVAAALVAGGCEPVVFVGGDTELLARFGHPVVPDRFPGQGPAGGVLSTLDAVPPGVVVVAACDVPMLDGEAVAAVARAVADGAGAAAVAVTDRWQPSLTAWRTSARGDLERAWTGGARALHELIAAVPHVEVAVDPEVLRNVNTRDELSAAEDASR
jgi:molybdopterin-guanine dinucleotide biosynthesis protein A